MNFLTVDVINPSAIQEAILRSGEGRGKKLEFMEKLSQHPTKLKITLDPKLLNDSAEK